MSRNKLAPPPRGYVRQESVSHDGTNDSMEQDHPSGGEFQATSAKTGISVDHMAAPIQQAASANNSHPFRSVLRNPNKVDDERHVMENNASTDPSVFATSVRKGGESAMTSIPAIYAVPTSDTFDDSTVLGGGSLAAATSIPKHSQSRLLSQSTTPIPYHYDNHKRSSQHDNNNTATMHICRHSTHKSSTTVSSQQEPPRPPGHSHTSPRTPISSSRKGASSDSSRSTKQQPSKRKTRARSNAPPPRKPSTGPRDFQHHHDWPRVSVKSVNVNIRSAYGLTPCPTVQEWNDLAATGGASTGADGRKTKLPLPSSAPSAPLQYRRMSPSLQHLEMIQRLQQQTIVRQLLFSPSCGYDADPFVAQSAALGKEFQSPFRDQQKREQASTDNTTRREPTNNVKSKKNSTTKRPSDGRYRAVDIVQAYINSLPEAAPILSHRKMRLPTRADVGFPGATEAEIIAKQGEIAHETEWEEATPRLVVLVTTSDLGTTVEDETYHVLTEPHLHWNGGGWEGMPFCGPELLRAMDQNAVQWGRRHQQQKHQQRQTRRKRKEQTQSTQEVLPSPQDRIWQPNSSSVLAPPLDATYSKSQGGWRPRLFHDRPPGWHYVAVCPTHVQFTSNLVQTSEEPLLCSLTLYKVATSGTTGQPTEKNIKGGRKSRTHYGSKRSEEFWFPAGNWRGKANLNIAQRPDGNYDASILEAWYQRQHKAIFSFPSHGNNRHEDGRGDLSNSDDDDEGALFVVVKVVKVASPPASATGTDTDASLVKSHGDGVYQQFGMQLLAPVGFGITKLQQEHDSVPSSRTTTSSYSPPQQDASQWPLGLFQTVDLVPFPEHPESHEAFVERLIHMVSEKEESSKTKAQTANGTPSDPASGATCRKSRMGRIFRSPLKNRSPMRHRGAVATSTARSTTSSVSSASSSAVTTSVASSLLGRSTTVTDQTNGSRYGSVQLFVSWLGADFLECMLSEPPELSATSSPGNPTTPTELPRVLVDPTGDAAILLRGSGSTSLSSSSSREAQIHSNNNHHKRSHLVRLPPVPIPADYVQAAELREVLAFPARPEKSYDLDPPLPTYRSLVNFLFVYPRSIKTLVGGEATAGGINNGSSFTVRFRLVKVEHQTTLDNKSTMNGQPLSTTASNKSMPVANVHSNAPWAGKSLVESAYTTILGTSDVPLSNLQQGIPFLFDEFKVRLPLLLDGTFYLEFILFAVEPVPNQGVALRPLAEPSLVPLSSSGTRDAGSGSKVATVIPNGNHRVKLGDFQLTVETRLVSSVHISGDTAVAVALRDFPLARPRQLEHLPNGNGDSAVAMEKGENGTVTSAESTKQTALEGSVDIRSDIDKSDEFPLLLSAAFPASVVAHFPVLLYMHLSNLVNLRDKVYSPHHGAPSRAPGTQFMMGTMLSLFQLLEKAKAKFLNGGRNGPGRLGLFIKDSIDVFDEAILSKGSSLSDQAESAQDQEVVDATSSRHNDTDSTNQQDLDDDLVVVGSEGDRIDEVAVRLKSRMMKAKNFELRVTKIKAELGAAGVPLARSSFGASKIDRMLAEAEILSGPATLEQFFDDDETIATISTFHPSSNRVMSGAVESARGSQKIASNNVNPNDVSQLTDNIIMDDGDTTSSVVSTKPMDENGGFGQAGTHSEFARRFKSAAHVMLAPCVGHTLANILAPRPSPRSGFPEESPKGTTLNKDDVKKSQSIILEVPSLQESESIEVAQSGTDDEGEDVDNIRNRGFRGPPDTPVLLFSASRGSESDFFVSCGNFLYESIIVLWLRAWLDHIEDGITNSSGSMDSKITSFVLPSPSLTQPAHQSPIFSFFANMDFLLPLCTKSIALRFNIEVLSRFPPWTKALVDEGHLRVLEPFIEMLARGLMGQALSGLKHSEESLDIALLRALESSGVVHDFITGLTAVLHPEHVRSLITQYFRTLRDCETEHLGDLSSIDFRWTEENLHRVRASRQLRLQAIERFAVFPAFLAMNYPRKFTSPSSSRNQRRTQKSDWLHQCTNASHEDEFVSKPKIQGASEKLPRAGWLMDMLTKESLSICSLSSESVVAEAMAHIEVSRHESGSSGAQPTIAPSLKKRPGAALKRSDLLMFQALSIQAITCVYELIIRRHAMDKRFQGESGRGRIAGMLASAILDKSITSVRWLARMEANHRVRSTWLLCVIYVLQEAPEHLITLFVRSYYDPQDFKIHRFIRLLRLCTSSFQNFIDRPLDSKLSPALDKGLSAWLLQESFNTICAATNTVVDACAGLTSHYPQEEKKMLHGLLDLLLHILTTPQSSVTHLRAVGGALQALEQFGVQSFTEIAGTNFQHWIRVVLTLMNSTSLSVRSIAVDFLVSLLGSTFDKNGNIGEVSLIMASVLPEVVAREIALYSVRDLVKTFDDVSRVVWPLRRSLVDLDGNPLDDDRIDPYLSPILTTLCRACQAVIDGVLIELRLKGNKFLFPSNDFRAADDTLVFDADEESLYEAASFFLPETGPMQRIRWLKTLVSVHEKKGQWAEAAESLIMCSRTILDSIRHLKYVWRPSKFLLWSDSRRSHWLEDVGEESSQPDRGNSAVIDFANEFLEPYGLLWEAKKTTAASKLQQPTASALCEVLCDFAKEAVAFYLREGGMEEQAFAQFLTLQRTAMNVLEDGPRFALRGAAARKRFEEDASIRRALVSLGVEITSLTERMSIDDSFSAVPPPSASPRTVLKHEAMYVFIRISGKKPPRFHESTSLPCFLEWRETSICRIPRSILDDLEISSVEEICFRFADPLIRFLQHERGNDKVELIYKPNDEREESDENMTYLVVYPANSSFNSDARWLGIQRRRFYIVPKNTSQSTVEMTVAQPFPCPLSRQRSVLTAVTSPLSVPMS